MVQDGPGSLGDILLLPERTNLRHVALVAGCLTIWKPKKRSDQKGKPETLVRGQNKSKFIRCFGSQQACLDASILQYLVTSTIHKVSESEASLGGANHPVDRR
jgi:hypothetical protein